MLYCQLSALPVFAWSSMTGTRLPPVSVYQRRTPGRSAYPAKPGLKVWAADAMNRNNDPASACKPRRAAAPRAITIRCVPFIGLLLRFNFSIPFATAATGAVISDSSRYLRKQTGPYPYFEQTVSNKTALFNSDSAVEGEAQDKAQAFRGERNGPVPLNAVAGIGAMSGVLKRCERRAK